MTNYLRRRYAATFLAVVSLMTLTGSAEAAGGSDSFKLLTAQFASRQVVKIEAGDFHFKPGQIAPVHTHAAPAVGYIAKGAIIYQVEGEKPQVLRKGDAFYEPADKRILRFDNASATEEAIFLDFNLQQKGEPFIVFEEQPREAIDRRTLPTASFGERSVDRVDIYTSEIAKGGALDIKHSEPTMGIVAEGVVEIHLGNKAVQRVAAGATFALPIDARNVKFVNTSNDVPASVVTFRLN